MKFEIWSEGYRATGENGIAFYHGMAEGKDFLDACKNFANDVGYFNENFKKYFNSENLTLWGCKLFNNESEARATFG